MNKLLMNKLLMMQLLCQTNYGYNPEYENLSEEEKNYLDYIEKCLYESDEKFSNACVESMFLILEVFSKIGTDEELTDEDITLKKEKIILKFSQEEKDRIESFMFACIQTIGIYSEERVQERKTLKEKTLIKKNSSNN